jgi:creatinine amidohydrolase
MPNNTEDPKWTPLTINETKHFRTAELTFPKLQTILTQDPVVIIPTGSHEQHGPHLPFSTDSIIAQTLAEHAAARLKEKAPILVTPLLPFGASIEHMDFPGTMSLRPETLYMIITDIVDSLAHAGVQKVLIMNGHGGNIHTIGSALHPLTRKHKMFIGFTSPTRLVGDTFAKLQDNKSKGAFHAGEYETSLLLLIASKLVNQSEIRDHTLKRFYDDTQYLRLWKSKFIKEFGWTTKQITDSGVIGDPTHATAAKGLHLYNTAVENLCKLLLEIHQQINSF